jgi:hypothetical protein
VEEEGTEVVVLLVVVVGGLEEELELELLLEDGEVGELGSGGSWSLSAGGDDDLDHD